MRCWEHAWLRHNQNDFERVTVCDLQELIRKAFLSPNQPVKGRTKQRVELVRWEGIHITINRDGTPKNPSRGQAFREPLPRFHVGQGEFETSRSFARRPFNPSLLGYVSNRRFPRLPPRGLRFGAPSPGQPPKNWLLVLRN